MQLKSLFWIASLAALVSGCVSSGESEVFRKPSESKKYDVVAKALKSTEPGAVDFNLFITGHDQPVGEKPVGQLRFRSSKLAPSTPIVTWVGDERIEVTCRPEHTHNLPPSYDLELNGKKETIRLTFQYQSD